jgi:Mn2+/Fe2+ NRAMP family transporter
MEEIADLGNIGAEFAGVASGFGILGVSKYAAVPLTAFAVWVLIVYGSYQNVERLLLVLSLVYFAYPVSAFMAHPDWHTRCCVKRSCRHVRARRKEYVVMIVGLIGTTITPWMQFYLHASLVEKGITERQWAMSRWDVIVGRLRERRLSAHRESRLQTGSGSGDRIQRAVAR